jgi:hypothetical protein
MILILVACSSGPAVASPNEVDRSPAVQQQTQWVKPQELEENDIEISQRAPVSDNNQTQAQAIELSNPNSTAENAIVSGFRVQLQAGKSPEQMQEALLIAKSYFNPRGFEVYLVYESPMYKLRVGDAKTRKSAEKILAQCRQQGYRDAWVVPDLVNSALDQED